MTYAVELFIFGRVLQKQKKGVLKNFARFTGKHLSQGLFFNKVTGLRPANLLEKTLWYKCFPVNFAKILRTPILKTICEQLLLVAVWINT